MTFEELKQEAKKQGFNLVKQPVYIPLAKCSCGASRSVRCLYSIYGDRYKCIKCGLEGNPGKTNRQARENWNKAVESVQKKDNCDI